MIKYVKNVFIFDDQKDKRGVYCHRPIF